MGILKFRGIAFIYLLILSGCDSAIAGVDNGGVGLGSAASSCSNGEHNGNSCSLPSGASFSLAQFLGNPDQIVQSSVVCVLYVIHNGSGYSAASFSCDGGPSQHLAIPNGSKEVFVSGAIDHFTSRGFGLVSFSAIERAEYMGVFVNKNVSR